MSSEPGALEAALAAWFPDIPAFRERQREVLERLMGRRSTLLLMPTGGGKSLTYQLPVLATGGIGVIVSPLIALMREQAERLVGLGARALSLGGLEAMEAQEQLRKFDWAAGPGFVFMSPERAETDGYLEHLLRANKSRDRGEIRLVRSPDNVLHFRSHGLDVAQAQVIADEIDAKVDKRLADFDTFKALIESTENPTSALKARFDS